MGAATNLFRRGAIYYYRRRIRWSDSEFTTLCLSLGTRRLEEARWRTTRLAACCDTLRARLMTLRDRELLTQTQRAEILHRQLRFERDRLAALHGTVLSIDNCDIKPQRYSEIFLHMHLPLIERVSNEWVAYGHPRPGQFKNLAEYIEAELSPDLDELERIWLEASLGSIEIMGEILDRGARTALHGVGAPCTAANIGEALSLSYGAKAQGVRSFRESLEHPGQLTSASEPGGSHPPKGEYGCYPLDADYPLTHLLAVGPGGWEVGDRVSPGGEPIVLVQPPGAEPPRVPGGTIVEGDWARVTIREAAARYLVAAVHVGGDAQKMSRKRTRWSPKTIRQFETMAMLFGKAFPGPIVQFSQNDLDRVNNLFDRLPSNHHKSSRHAEMSLEEICEEASGSSTSLDSEAHQIGLSIATTNRHFGFFKSLWDWVRGRMPSISELDWRDIRIRDDRDKRDERKALGVEQGSIFFNLPIWTGCEAQYGTSRFQVGSHIYHDSAYWVPLLIWYSGMRREECCKLLLGEIENVHGIWCFYIKDNNLGTIKNSSSRRKIPIHSEIIRLGFMDYVEEMRRCGKERLFPDLIAKINPGEQWNKKWGNGFHKSLIFFREWRNAAFNASYGFLSA